MIMASPAPAQGAALAKSSKPAGNISGLFAASDIESTGRGFETARKQNRAAV
jgi:hypothetical protein